MLISLSDFFFSKGNLQECWVVLYEASEFARDFLHINNSYMRVFSHSKTRPPTSLCSCDLRYYAFIDNFRSFPTWTLGNFICWKYLVANVDYRGSATQISKAAQIMTSYRHDLRKVVHVHYLKGRTHREYRRKLSSK